MKKMIHRLSVLSCGLLAIGLVCACAVSEATRQERAERLARLKENISTGFRVTASNTGSRAFSLCNQQTRSLNRKRSAFRPYSNTSTVIPTYNFIQTIIG